MISPARIQRMVQMGAHSGLVRRILANGRCQSPLARQRLVTPTSAAPAGIGLALQRLCELTYRPHASASDLVRRLVSLQRSDGLFGTGNKPCIAASAVALRGLLDYRRQAAEAGFAVQESVVAAIDRGITALASALGQSAPHQPARVDIEVVLWQLGRIDAFRQAAPVSELAATLFKATAESRADDLARFATASAA